jgi:hypothetical protein
MVAKDTLALVRVEMTAELGGLAPPPLGVVPPPPPTETIPFTNRELAHHPVAVAAAVASPAGAAAAAEESGASPDAAPPPARPAVVPAPLAPSEAASASASSAAPTMQLKPLRFDDELKGANVQVEDGGLLARTGCGMVLCKGDQGPGARLVLRVVQQGMHGFVGMIPSPKMIAPLDTGLYTPFPSGVPSGLLNGQGYLGPYLAYSNGGRLGQ